MISGDNFGFKNHYNGDSAEILVTDLTQGWNAGCKDRGKTEAEFRNSCIYDSVTLRISRWDTNLDQDTNNAEIDIEGFTGDYGGCCRLYANDRVRIRVWNVWNAVGPSDFYDVTVSECSPPSPTQQMCAYYPPGQGHSSSSSTSVPATPSNVQVVGLVSSTLYITWTPNFFDETGFEITRDQHFAPEIRVPAGQYDYVWDGLPAGSYICISVRAFNSAGTSNYSDWGCTSLPSP